MCDPGVFKLHQRAFFFIKCFCIIFSVTITTSHFHLIGIQIIWMTHLIENRLFLKKKKKNIYKTNMSSFRQCRARRLEVLFSESSQTRRGSQWFLLAFLELAEYKVKICRCGHGVEDVCLVRYLQLCIKNKNRI